MRKKNIQEIDLKGKVKRTVLHTVVWKFRDFSVTQILREINLGGS